MSGQAPDELRPVFYTTGIHPGARPAVDTSLQAIRIKLSQAHYGTAPLQIEVGKQVGTPRSQASSQGRKRGRPCAGAQDHQLFA
jgi:hypothetical protein